MSSAPGWNQEPDEDRPAKRYDVQPWRKAVFYIGWALIIIGVLLVAVIFIEIMSQFDQMSNGGREGGLADDDAGMPRLMDGLAGVVLIAVGQILQRLGRQGAAGSGLILSPKGEVKDAEPWQRSQGAKDEDRLEEIPTLTKALSSLGTTPLTSSQIRIRCQNCGYLETEDAQYCSKCGKPL